MDYYKQAWEDQADAQDRSQYDKAYGVLDGRENISDFFKGAGMVKSPFGYLPANPDSTAGDLASITGGIGRDFRDAMGLTTGRIPGTGMVRADRKSRLADMDTIDSNLALGLSEGNAARSYSRDVGIGAANTAAQAYLSNAGGGEGRDKAGAAVVRARSLLPAMAADANMAMQLADMRNKAMDQKLENQTGLDKLSSDYLASNASFLANRMNTARSLTETSSTARTAQAGQTAAYQAMLAGLIPRRQPTIV